MESLFQDSKILKPVAVSGENMGKKCKVIGDPVPPLSYGNLYKNLLQEACRKGGFPDPIYEIVKYGPDHEPTFTASVCINTVVYNSVDPKPKRRAAEQNCAKVALPKLYGVDNIHQLNMAQLVAEAGLCKSMLGEYAQRKQYPLPTYECQIKYMKGKQPMIFAVVKCGDLKYDGSVGKNKKEAERNVAMYACAQIMAAFTSNSRVCGVADHETKL